MKAIYDKASRSYRLATTKEIRDGYFESMTQETFVVLFSDQDMKTMRELGFKSFRGYQNRAVVKYIVEKVGRLIQEEE